MSDKQIILTASGYRRIEKELNELQTVRRSQVAGDIRAAKEFGDVAENPEYESAKTEQALLEGRIQELKSILNSARVIDDREAPTDVVGVGSVVRVRDLDHQDEWDYTIVGSVEADPEMDLISNESPIGEALMGRRVGDRVEVDIPAGKAHYEIVSIRRAGEEE